MAGGIKANQLDGATPRVEEAQSVKPTTATGQGATYTKLTAGIAELFYVDDQGQEIQLTLNGLLKETGGGGTVSDVAYPTGWDSDTAQAPSRNATFDKINSMDTAISSNTSKVSASGSIDTHSDVDTTTSAPSAGEVLKWDGSNWVPAADGGGGASIDDTAYPTGWDTDTTTAPSRNATFDKLDSMDTAISSNTSKVSADGSVTSHSDVGGAAPTDGQVLTYVNANNRYEPATPTGGSGTTEDVVIQLGASASIADKVTNAPVGGIPVGITVSDGTVSPHASFGGLLNAFDLLIKHNKAKICIAVESVGEVTFPSNNFNQAMPSGSDSGFPSGTMKTSSDGNQTAIIGWNVALGPERTWTIIKLLPILT